MMMAMMTVLLAATATFQMGKTEPTFPIPTVSAGSIHRLADFPSQYVAPRNVDVWLPPNYDATQKYPVVYFHDGQMLFDETITWNKQEWKLDEVASDLIAANKIRPFIAVGVFNTGATRHSEYFPAKPIELLPESLKASLLKDNLAGRSRSDAYLKFLVTELKPYIDAHFSTLTDTQNTMVAGSSMGGLISMYAFTQYPQVFGAAACFSTHWPGNANLTDGKIPAAFQSYLESSLPRTNSARIMFLYGDKTLDALYPPHQKKVDELMAKKGWKAPNWTTKFYPGDDHSEKSWAKQLPDALVFLLGK